MKADEFAKRFKQIMQDALEDIVSSDTVDTIGETAVELIKKRTRLGYGVSEQGGSKKKLDALSEPYKKQRKKNKPKGPSTPSKSNLTNTGDMLDSMIATKSGTGKVEIGFDNTEDQKKAEYVSEKRPFNNLSKSETKQIEQELNEIAKKKIAKALNKLK